MREKDKKLTTKEDWNKKDEYPEEIEEDTSWEDELEVEPPKKESLFKRILKGVGTGGLVISGGILFTIFSILQFLFTAVAGIGMIWWAVILFSEGSIIMGLLVLLIGTPIAIGLAHWAFFFFLVLGILSGIIWGVANLFGLDVSFGNMWDIVWLAIKTLLLGGMAFLGISGFIGAIKEKKVAEFLKENWFYILFFFFLLWLFF